MDRFILKHAICYQSAQSMGNKHGLNSSSHLCGIWGERERERERAGKKNVERVSERVRGRDGDRESESERQTGSREDK